MITSKIKCIILIAVSIICVFLFYLGTKMYPLCSDDMGYTFICGLEEKVSSVYDVFVSQANHYMRVNGRYVAHCAVQVALLFDREYFCVLNALCYAFCAGIMAMMASSFVERRLEIWLVVLVSFWILMPHSGSTMLWLTGSFNYLWNSALSILFLACLFSSRKFFRCSALLIGIIAGNGHECVSVGLLVALISYAFLTPRRDALFYWGIVIYALSAATNVFSPGSFNRLNAHALAGADFDFGNTIVGWCRTCLKIVWMCTIQCSDFSLRICLGLWIISAFIILYHLKKGEKQYIFPLCFLLGALATLGINVVSKSVYPRAFYGFCLFSYFASLLVFGQIVSNKRWQWTIWIVLSCLLLMNAVEIPKAYRSITTLRVMYERIDDYANSRRTIVPEIMGWSEAKQSRYVESYGVFSSVLANGLLKRYYNGLEMSILPQTVCDSVSRSANALSGAENHQRVYGSGGVWFEKLKRRPLRASISQSIQPAIPSFVALFAHRLGSPRSVEKAMPVICVGDAYFVYGEAQEATLPLKIVYSNREKCINPSPI